MFPQQKRLNMTSRPDNAKHLLGPGQLIRTIQDLLGHKAVSTTMFYTLGLNPSPLRGKPRPTFRNRPNSWFSDP